MKKHPKNNNIHFLAVIIEFDDKIITVMTIQNQKLISICCMRFNIISKMW